jgi:GNAT superfamily N-acetyltransferase
MTDVRFAEPADTPFLVQMARLADALEDRPLPHEDDPAVLALLPGRADAALVATDDLGRAIGAAWWHFPASPLLRGADGNPLPEMAIAVLDSARGQGVGTCLIDALANEAARRSVPALALNVHLRNPAARLYTRTGFRVAGAGRGWFGVAMIRDLPLKSTVQAQPGPTNTLAAVGAAMAAERSALLGCLADALHHDERIVAAWVGGSIGRGEADDLSDIDIHLAVVDERCAELNAQRRAFVAQFGEPLLIQEAPQNAPPSGAFQLVLYRGAAAPIEVDWSWRPASAAAIPQRAVVLFDRSGGLPSAASSVTLSSEDVARQISLSTTFFWAMAFIAAKKIARHQPAAAFGLLRMMHQARDGVRDHLAGKPQPTWGAIAAPRENLPPSDPQGQIVDLSELLADMDGLQRTTDGEGGLVTEDSVTAVRAFVQLIARELAGIAADSPSSA